MTGTQARFLILTDLDATLLDHETYSAAAAAPALAAVVADGIPLVICTSKTRAEVEVFRETLGIRDPFIVENGGAIVFPSRNPSEAPRIVRFGAPYDALVAMLRDIRMSTGIQARGFHDMDAQEIARRCGFTVADAELARRREHDEPFVVEPSGDREAQFIAALETAGGHVTRGGRFLHLTGGHDKGRAARFVIDDYRAQTPGLRTVALGDGPNDVPLLQCADVAVIVRSPAVDTMTAALPHARVTRASGPAGWNEAVLDLLRR